MCRHKLLQKWPGYGFKAIKISMLIHFRRLHMFKLDSYRQDRSWRSQILQPLSLTSILSPHVPHYLFKLSLSELHAYRSGHQVNSPHRLLLQKRERQVTYNPRGESVVLNVPIQTPGSFFLEVSLGSSREEQADLQARPRLQRADWDYDGGLPGGARGCVG